MVDVVEQVFVMAPEVRHVQRRSGAGNAQCLVDLIRVVPAVLQIRACALADDKIGAQILILQHLDEQV